MFFNGVKCDIYIGSGAGKKLINDINRVEKSVEIVSPFLNKSLLDLLIRLHRRGISIKLVTTDGASNFYKGFPKNYSELIVQNRITDKSAQEKRKRWIHYSKILLRTVFVLIIALFGIMIYLKDFLVVLGLIPIVIVFIVYQHRRVMIKSIRIFNYSYSTLFPIKIYKCSDLENRLHSKIYLIDNQVAYLGSLNFTYSGTKKNHETRIRIWEPAALKKIKEEIDYLFEDDYQSELDFHYWGKRLHGEPIN